MTWHGMERKDIAWHKIFIAFHVKEIKCKGWHGKACKGKA
jgi:hypothetical protein